MAGYKFPERQLFLRSNVGTLILFVQAIPFLSWFWFFGVDSGSSYDLMDSSLSS